MHGRARKPSRFEGVICVQEVVPDATIEVLPLSDEQTFAEAVRLVEPEQLPADQINQYSVEQRAMEFQSLLNRFTSLKDKLAESGLELGGRVLLIGPPETDFGAFVRFLGREVPIKLVTFRQEEILNEKKRGADALRVGFEFARRSSPAIMFAERIEMLAPAGSERSAALHDEISRTSWDDDEVLLIASTTKPSQLDEEMLTLFDRTFVIEVASSEDRVRVFERVLKGRKDIDTAMLADLTQGWGFQSVKRLAVSLVMTEASANIMQRDDLEKLIAQSGVMPLNDPATLGSIVHLVERGASPSLSRVETEYPDDFIDQLYLMSVGEDYARTQRVVEVLNDGLPLSSEDRGFLSKHPHLLNGTAEERLTRLLRAKKSSDRLQRIMGK